MDFVVTNILFYCLARTRWPWHSGCDRNVSIIFHRGGRGGAFPLNLVNMCWKWKTDRVTVFVGEVWCCGRATEELHKTAQTFGWQKKKKVQSVRVHCSESSLARTMRMPCIHSAINLGQSATQDTYSAAPVYGYVAGFQTEAAERMGEPCFECSLSFQMSFVLHIQGVTQITAPCQSMFQQTPIPDPPSRTLRAFSDITQMSPDGRPRLKSHITNNTASGAGGEKSVDSALKAPDGVVY